jgi:hypothetical protein
VEIGMADSSILDIDEDLILTDFGDGDFVVL